MPEDTSDVGAAVVTPDESLHNLTRALSLPRCPICRARLRENTTCPRCGSDLSLLERVAHEASSLEQVAVTHLLLSEWASAKAVLVEVQRLRATELSGQLQAFAEHQLLASSCSPDKDSHSVESEGEHSSLATLDLSMIERYG